MLKNFDEIFYRMTSRCQPFRHRFSDSKIREYVAWSSIWERI